MPFAQTAVRCLLLALPLSLAAACTPRPLVRAVARSHPGCLYELPSREKVVALTIDDGPDPATTPRLLKLLKEHNAHATFFLISDRVSGNDAVVTSMLEQEHEIGNHFTRNQASIGLSPEAFTASLVRADSVLRQFAPVRWVRPGSGFYNARMIREFVQRDYQCALGSVHPFDPQLPFAWFGSRVVLREVYPGAVIILHDGGYKGRNTEKVLARVLPELARRGYRVVTLSALASGDTARTRKGLIR